MYRCISELKGLVIDIESFTDNCINDWADIINKYRCLFLVTDEENAKKLNIIYGDEIICYKMAKFVKMFAPSQSTHGKALKLLGLKATEVAYVSQNKNFLENAMGFLGGTIWITDKLTYEDVATAPDLICTNFASFKQVVLSGVKGFFGEVKIYPDDESKGMIIQTSIGSMGKNYPLYMLGRYFGTSHYMNQLHPYSSAISLNKYEKGKAFGSYNIRFFDLYKVAVKRIQIIEKVDGILAVPTRLGQKDRFKTILQMVSTACGIQNLGANFRCIRDYPTQKSLTAAERQENIKGAFYYKGDLSGKHVILIDDVVTTGSTIQECIEELMCRGADKVSIVVLAVNQKRGNYWCVNEVQVSCSQCGEKMHLLINSKNKDFFYSCYSCRSTKNFEEGRMELYEKVNKEMEDRDS